jgi:GNAT superfamily N-acetyltransferase
MAEKPRQQTSRQRPLQREESRQPDFVEIIAYKPAYRDDFRCLNIEWLERYFHVEEIDERVLGDPEAHILANGGFIFFARAGSDIVGTVALIKAEPDCYELSKMSVTDAYQGLGIGRKLAEVAIRQFEETGGRQLYLESNSRLTPALTLYESLGFARQPARADSEYRRADVCMVYWPQGR